MNIDEMPAGPELDALVAEKVMGLTPCNHWLDAMGSLSIVHAEECDAPVKLECYDAKPGRWNKKYSTNIAAAWEVVGKLTKEDQFCSLTPLDGLHKVEGWICRMMDDELEGRGNTAPLAICRAALKAVTP